MSDNKRNEGQLLQDVLGLESLVDEITYTLANEATDQPTATAVRSPRLDQAVRLLLTTLRFLVPSGVTVLPKEPSETPSSTKTRAAT